MPQPCVPNISDDRPCATGGYGGEFGLSLLNTDGGWLVEDVFLFGGGLRQSRGNCLDPQFMGLFSIWG